MISRTFAATSLIIALLAPGARALASEFDDMLSAVEKLYEEKTDFAAEFTQTVVRAHLPDRPATKEGRFYFKKPGMMRFDYIKPDQVFYISDGKVFWNYIPESNLAYKLKVEESDLFYALRFLYGQGSLRKEFAVSDGGTEASKRIIVLKPTSAQHNFQQVRLFVTSADSHIVETEITDPAGNTSRLRFTKMSFEPVSAESFKFAPPEGVQVEDLSSQVGSQKP